MTEHKAIRNAVTVINLKSPWTVTQRGVDWPYSYKVSASQWRALLARASSGDREAEWEVADRYADGCKDNRGKIIVRRSATKAARWFRRAAEHGSTPAQNNLGVLLSSGNGSRKNVEGGLFWLRKAFRDGDPCAGQNIAITYRENGNLRAAVKWFRKSADAGDCEALVQLGIHYYWGKGIRKDANAAVQCFRRATKAKNISGMGRDDAFFFLAIAYYEGRGVNASIPDARKLFKRANADGDHPAACMMLSEL